jgi:hypothetical protein
MLKQTLLAAVFGVLAVGVGSARADSMSTGRPGTPGQDRGYLPWRGGGFGAIGFGPVYAANSGSGPQQQAQAYDIAPAMGQAAFANAEFENRWSELQVIIDRARSDFQMSTEYGAAKDELDNSQHAYDAAVDAVMARLQNDQQYKQLIEKRTQEQIALKSAAVGTGLRNSVADAKLRVGSMVTQMEAVALANDSAVQDARVRLTAADESMRLREKQFESQLYNRREIVSARTAMETARVNKAAADGYLRGAYITRADQLGLSAASNTGNTVFLSGLDPYFRAYYGM